MRYRNRSLVYEDQPIDEFGEDLARFFYGSALRQNSKEAISHPEDMVRDATKLFKSDFPSYRAVVAVLWGHDVVEEGEDANIDVFNPYGIYPSDRKDKQYVNNFFDMDGSSRNDRDARHFCYLLNRMTFRDFMNYFEWMLRIYRGEWEKDSMLIPFKIHSSSRFDDDGEYLDLVIPAAKTLDRKSNTDSKERRILSPVEIDAYDRARFNGEDGLRDYYMRKGILDHFRRHGDLSYNLYELTRALTRKFEGKKYSYAQDNVSNYIPIMLEFLSRIGDDNPIFHVDVLRSYLQEIQDESFSILREFALREPSEREDISILYSTADTGVLRGMRGPGRELWRRSIEEFVTEETNGK